MRLLISALQSKVLHFLRMNLIIHLQLLSLSQFYSAKKRKNSKRFKAHRLKIKLQNESNVNILKLQVLNKLTQFKKNIDY